MFNSVAKYLWGSVENEGDYTDDRPEQSPIVQETPIPDDGDWVLVDTVDKENCAHTVSHHHPHLPHHPSPTHPAFHHNNQPWSCPSSVADSPFPPASGPSDIELLDDAASLAQHLAVVESKSNNKAGSRVPTPSACCRLPNANGEFDSVDSSDFDEENGTDSGVRPSSPESVFSACSGRSHATYRPKGHASEVWVVAPPPCFTGSQLGDNSGEPLASSPLENLLIEHPSMSVYYSLPLSSLPSSHPVFSLPAIADTTTTAGAGQASEDVATREGDGALSPAASQSQPHCPHHHHHRRPHSQAALHTIQLSPERLLEKSRLAQRHQLSQKDKVVSNQHCRRQNLVRNFSSASKRSNNRRNKLMRPSGCKSSRNSQRVH